MFTNLTMITEVLIQWGAVVVDLVIFFLIIYFVLLFNSFKAYTRQFNAKNWNHIVEEKSDLQRIARISTLHDHCMYMLAKSYFELYNDVEFANFLEKMKYDKVPSRMLNLKATYMILQSDEPGPYLSELIGQLSTFEDEASKKLFATTNLLYMIKFQGYTPSPKELELINELNSDRVKKSLCID